jgi:hypothetical protein
MANHVSMEVQMVKRIALVFGVVFLLVGVLGLVLTPAGMQMGVDSNAQPLLGLFPVNLLHNVVHILFGIWGLLAARSFAGAVLYCKAGGVIYIVLAVCGLAVPGGFGLVPLGGNDVYLHAVLGIVLGGVGFTAKEEAMSPAAA